MNTALVTGYLPQGAWEAWTKQAQRILCFKVVLRDEVSAEESTWSCEIDDPAEMARVGNSLLAGRGVVLRGKLAARPFVKDKVTVGFVHFLRVERVEFVKADQSSVEMAPDDEPVRSL